MGQREGAIHLLDHEVEWARTGSAYTLLRPLSQEEEENVERLQGERLQPFRPGKDMPGIGHFQGLNLWTPYDLLEKWVTTEELRQLRPVYLPGIGDYEPYQYRASGWKEILPETVWHKSEDMPEEAVRLKAWITEDKVCRLLDLKDYEIYDLVPQSETLLVLPEPPAYVVGIDGKLPRKKPLQVLMEYMDFMKVKTAEAGAQWFERFATQPMLTWVRAVHYSICTQGDLRRYQRKQEAKREEG